MTASGGEKRWVNAVVLDVSDLDRGSTFWCELLGLKEVKRREQYAYLDGLGGGIELILQQVDDVKVTKNRMHLEIESEDPPKTIAWVNEHGGRLVEEHETDWYSLVVMADPDGNEFCVGRTPQTAPPR